MMRITRDQAKRFLLAKQGLMGRYRFAGKEGVYQYIRQAGCIQFDPVDVCGKNAELTLQSRVRGFRKQMLSDLLYKDRLLFDYIDKELSIWRTGPTLPVTGRGAGNTDSVSKAYRNWRNRRLPISGSTVRSAVIPSRSPGRFSGILPCTGAATGSANPRRRDRCWSSCIQTVHW